MEFACKKRMQSRTKPVETSLSQLKVQTHTTINLADFVSWCMLYTYEGNNIREEMTMYFCGLTIKSHSPGYEIGPINRSV